MRVAARFVAVGVGAALLGLGIAASCDPYEDTPVVDAGTATPDATVAPDGGRWGSDAAEDAPDAARSRCSGGVTVYDGPIDAANWTCTAGGSPDGTGPWSVTLPAGASGPTYIVCELALSPARYEVAFSFEVVVDGGTPTTLIMAQLYGGAAGSNLILLREPASWWFRSTKGTGISNGESTDVRLILDQRGAAGFSATLVRPDGGLSAPLESAATDADAGPNVRLQLGPYAAYVPLDGSVPDDVRAKYGNVTITKCP